MVIGCILALIMGVTLVSPLLILNTVVNSFPEHPNVYPNPQSNSSNIAVNLKNVNVELGTITLKKYPYPNSETVTQPALHNAIVLSATKYLNDNENIPDGEADYFLIQIFSSNGVLIRNMSALFGAAYNRTFESQHAQTITFYLMYKTFGFNYGGGGEVHWTWPIGTTITNSFGGHPTIGPNTANLLANSQTLTMTLSRVGSIVFRGNSTIVSTSDAGLIESVQLVKQGEGFIFNQDGSSVPVPIRNYTPS
jgi:hypothetical protein